MAVKGTDRPLAVLKFWFLFRFGGFVSLSLGTSPLPPRYDNLLWGLSCHASHIRDRQVMAHYGRSANSKLINFQWLFFIGRVCSFY